ncbi:MAG: TspO/MBR family protein [Oscillospiraceae bacterium]|nr:TspO/MBR family protein [Oscillospiraceae bacterium]
MYKSVKFSLKRFLFFMILSLGTGALSALLTMNSTREVFNSIKQPPLTPPAAVFPVVWTILFFLMGISSFIVSGSRSEYKNKALIIFFVQLIINFTWSPLFFIAQMYFAAFICIVLLWIAIIAMIYYFYKVNPVAAFLQIPYLLWVTFAGYLNFMIYRLN